jgi:hypothetical protein
LETCSSRSDSRDGESVGSSNDRWSSQWVHQRGIRNSAKWRKRRPDPDWLILKEEFFKVDRFNLIEDFSIEKDRLPRQNK